jgi:transcription-repair coupling factor (superfamily II helicase)
VGRSDRKAFCYLLVPSIHGLTRESRQRLQAVEEFSDLGSGFQIAMRDLDIRGAGNMLGAEQSGFIEDVGFETYHKILDEAVSELRAEEFQDVFGEAEVPRPDDSTVDVDADAFIPESYLTNRVERLNVYRRISEASDPERLTEIRGEIVDRFGPIPPELETVLQAAGIKVLAQKLRFPKVSYKNERLFLSIPEPNDDPYFFEHLFQPLLGRLESLENRYVLKESSRTKKLRAIVQDIPDLEAAAQVLEKLLEGNLAA